VSGVELGLQDGNGAYVAFCTLSFRTDFTQLTSPEVGEELFSSYFMQSISYSSTEMYIRKIFETND
jgi:hypothetical protein